MTPAQYSRLLPALSLNLIVSDVDRSVAFYREVLGAELRYRDVDFAALTIGEIEFMLHADHTYEAHPWHGDLAGGRARGIGAEVRLLGVDPDGVERRAREHGATVVMPAADHAHGWREVAVRDPDGYEWNAGVLLETGGSDGSGGAGG